MSRAEVIEAVNAMDQKDDHNEYIEEKLKEALRLVEDVAEQIDNCYEKHMIEVIRRDKENNDETE